MATFRNIASRSRFYEPISVNARGTCCSAKVSLIAKKKKKNFSKYLVLKFLVMFRVVSIERSNHHGHKFKL